MRSNPVTLDSYELDKGQQISARSYELHYTIYLLTTFCLCGADVCIRTSIHIVIWCVVLVDVCACENVCTPTIMK